MSQELSTTPKTGLKGLSNFLNSDAVKGKFTEILGSKGVGFVASVLSAVSTNDLLKDADQNSIYTCALMAASLDLPINSNLGFAYLIPYNSKQKDGTYKKVCQFQIGYKGLKQLAQRSGQFKLITDAVVYEGQLIEENPLEGYKFDWKQKKSNKIIGFVSYFELLNGFKSTLYMTIEEIEKHGSKYSKTYSNPYGVWKTEFESMSLKTVTKLNLSRNAPMSIEMQRATIADQMVINNYDNETDTIEGDYVDVTPNSINPEEISKQKEYDRITDHINEAKSVTFLEQVKDIEKDEIQQALYDKKMKEIKSKK